MINAMKCQQNLSLRSYNSLNIESHCAEIYRPETISELQSLPAFDEKPFYILGDGSNTLFVDENSPVIVKPNFTGIDINDQGSFFEVKVGASENWHNLVTHCIGLNILGLENLALIPGSVGAAPVQNIGAYGVDFADYCFEVIWFDFAKKEAVTLSKAECDFGYRDSIFKGELYNKGVITEVTFHFPKAWSANLSYAGLDTLTEDASAIDVMEKVIALRMSKLPDPSVIPNAGSFFKNPVVSVEQYEALKQQYPNIPSYTQADGNVKLAAGWLIDQAGLKGYHKDGVGVHKKQALVLVNYLNGSGKDIVDLAQYVQETISSKFKVDLEPEVRMVTSQGEVPFSALLKG